MNKKIKNLARVLLKSSFKIKDDIIKNNFKVFTKKLIRK
jgi:hypothetical protein